jgi:rubredoxin
VSERWVDAPVPCHDPECGGTAEPESDGELRYHACTTCGYEFNYEQASQDAGACQIGVPEDVRRAASIEPRLPDQPVFIGTIGRRPA